MTALTESKLKKLSDERKEARAKEVLRIWDGNGLYVDISPLGTVAFAMKFRRDGKERREGFGKWPTVTLADARRKARQIRAALDRKEVPLSAPKTPVVTFKEAVDEWKRVNQPSMAERTVTQVNRYLRECIEGFGEKALREIIPQDVLAVLRKIEERGALESAKRTRMYCEAIFNYAIAVGCADVNPATPLKAKGVMRKRPTARHFPAMPADKIPDLLARVAAGNIHPSIRAALTFTVLTALRTNEVLDLRWSDLAGDGASLTIPAERMKAGKAHTVILSTQARAVIESIRAFSTGREFVFPGRDPKNPLSQMAMLMTLRRMEPGYTVHGFRSSFSTWAHASGAAPHVVERCLAHARQDKVAAAYNRHTYDAEAAKLWQAWADEMVPPATTKRSEGRAIKSKSRR